MIFNLIVSEMSAFFREEYVMQLNGRLCISIDKPESFLPSNMGRSALKWGSISGAMTDWED